MENTRIGNAEAIALIITVIINHIILNMTKVIISSSDSAAILNTVYISAIALILSYIIYTLLKMFPTFDILDISNFLGGRILKVIIGVLFSFYFIFFSGTLLKNFAYCLQIIYYTSTNTFFIIVVFLIATVFVCNLKNNALFRSNLLIIPFIVISICILFLGNSGDFVFQNVFPVLGHGVNATFLNGISNLFAFQGLLHILFLPPRLKDVTKLRKISLLSITFSALYLLVSVAVALFLFDTSVTNSLLLPLYSAARYIEFGTFFQRLDSIFMLTWIISFASYLSIIISTCCNILKKFTNIKSTKFSSSIIAFIILAITLSFKNYAISIFYIDVVYKYAFFALLGISIAILVLAYISKYFKNKVLTRKTNSASLNGGTT